MLDKFGGWYLPILAGATAADFELDVCHPDFPLSGSTPISGWFSRVSDLPASSATTPIQGHLTPITNQPGSTFPLCSLVFALDFSGHNDAFAIQTTTSTTRGPTSQPPSGALEVCQGSAGASVGGLVAISLVASAGIGTWTATGSLHQDRANGATAVLYDGTVLVAGGNTNRDVYLASAEIYNPSTGTWSLTGSMHIGRNFFTATVLDSGKVLIAGGQRFDPTGKGNFRSEAELYDPSTRSWAFVQPMSIERVGHTATRLRNGKVLVAGGVSNHAILASAEIFDPETGAWTPTASMSTPRGYAAATLLADGEVLLAGGSDHFNNGPYLTSAEIYNPRTATWRTAGQMLTAHSGASAKRLFNGDVLVVGGYNLDRQTGVDIYHPATNSWSAGPNYIAPVGSQSAVVLPDCEVLVVGGIYFNSDQTQVIVESRAELYDPVANMWRSAGNMLSERFGGSIAVLRSGSVLVAGGGNNSGTLTNSELYTLPSETSRARSHDCEPDE